MPDDTQQDLDELIGELGLSYSDVSRRSGLPRMTIQRLRQGLIDNPRNTTLRPLAKVLTKGSVKKVAAACAESRRRANGQLTLG